MGKSKSISSIQIHACLEACLCLGTSDCWNIPCRIDTFIDPQNIYWVKQDFLENSQPDVTSHDRSLTAHRKQFYLSGKWKKIFQWTELLCWIHGPHNSRRRTMWWYLTKRPGFLRYVLFFRLLSCVRGKFLIFHKCSGFWPLSTVTFSVSVVVAWVKAHSSRRPHFNLRNYFTQFRSIRTLAGTALFLLFISNCQHRSGGCVEHRLVRVVFIAFLQ